MPQAPRKDNQVQRAQDKESKRARGALSCAECRRLKLKCDKTVPCSSCKRRGCSAICPNGSLITGQGTRFVLADTEVLHHKIALMSDRIRQLEDALAILHSTISGSGAEPHPLLSRDLLKVKSSIELHSASVGSAVVPEEARNRAPAEEDNEVEEPELHDTFGTLAIRDDGVATFYGRSAGSESLLIGEAAAAATASANTPPADSPHTNSSGLSPSLAHYPDYAGPSSSRPHTSTYPRHAYPGPPSSSIDASVAALAASFPLAPTLSVSPSSVLSSPTSYSSSSFGNALHQPPPATAQIQVPVHNLDVDTLIAHYRPAYEHAQALMRSYLELAPWFFGAVTRTQIEREIMPLWYPAETSSSSSETSPASVSTSPNPGGSLPPPPASSVSPASASQGFPVSASAGAVARRQRTAHDLALFFVLCCFGALNDSALPPAPDNAPAERYYQLTKAALSLDPAGGPSVSAGADSAGGHGTRYEGVMGGGTEAKMPRNGLLERPPSVATVQTLSLMAIYEGMCSGENSIETTWALMGLAGKLAQSIGLHRDCARWKLSPGEVQKRRALFWELFITDCWQSLATGRLATFSLPFVDCELPADPDQSLAEDGSTVPSFPFWKARFGAECVAAVVQGTLTSRAPKYAIILDLDRKVRDMELPAYAHGAPPQGAGLAKTMEHFMPHNYRELTLLYIHRCFFAHAISSHPLDPVKSQYAPSFLAGYRSACTIVGSVKQQFDFFPIQIARFWVLWTHAFSASVMLASVATNSSRSKIAPAALLELNMACDLFARASGYGGRAAKFLPILRRLQAKAQNAFREANSGQPPSIPNDIFRPSADPDSKDELSIFGGKTNTINTVAPGSASASSSKIVLRGASHDGRERDRGSDRASSDSPGQIFVDNPQFSGVHSSLVEELHDFQGQIRAQIQNAYRTGTDLFLGVPMVVDSDEPSGSAVGGHGRHQQQAPQYRRHAEEVREREMVEKEREEMERERLERVHEHEVEMQRQYQQQQLDLQRQEQQRQAQYQQQVETQRLEQQRHQQQQYQDEHEVQYHHHHTFEPAEQSLYASEPSTHTRPQRQAHAAPPPRQSSHPQSTPVVPSQAPYQDYRHSLSTQQADHMPANGQHHNHRHQHIYPAPQHHTPQHHAPQHHAHPHHHQAAYPVSVGYEHAQVHTQGHVPGPSTAYSNGSSMADAHHGHHHGYAHHGLHSTAPAPHAYGSEVQETFKYWPAASSSFAMPDQQSTTTKYVDAHYQHQYTPENALRGIAADDRGLQETWQSYMEKVGSPRQFFED